MLTKAAAILESLDSLNNIDQIRKDIRNIPRYDEYFDEGFLSNVAGAIKKGGKFVASQIKSSMLKMSNENRMRIENEFRDGLPKVSVEEHLRRVNSRIIDAPKSHNESSENVSESEDDSDTLIFESTLSTDQLRDFVQNFRNKYRVPIYIVTRYDSLDLRGGNKAFVTNVSDEQFEKIMNGDTLSHDEIVGTGNKQAIFIKEDVIQRRNANTQKKVNFILMHERGHLLTWNQLTKSDWDDYSCKTYILKLWSFLLDDIYGDIKGEDIIQAVYTHFKLEIIADRSVGIRTEDHLNATVGRKVNLTQLKSEPLFNIFNVQIPNDIIPHIFADITGGKYRISDAIAVNEFYIKMAKICLPDNQYRNDWISKIQDDINKWKKK